MITRFSSDCNNMPDHLPISNVRNPIEVKMDNGKLKLNNLSPKQEVSAQDLINQVLRDEKRNRGLLKAKYSDSVGAIK